jgi:hypothetical protein
MPDLAVESSIFRQPALKWGELERQNGSKCLLTVTSARLCIKSCAAVARFFCKIALLFEPKSIKNKP